MSCPVAARQARPSRRGFLAGAGGLAGRRGRGGAARAATTRGLRGAAERGIEPFWGEHQGGIATPQQTHTYFAAFDLTAKNARRGDDDAAAALDRRRRRA